MCIKAQRVESLLLEVLSEAIASLDDRRLNSLVITRIRAKGKQSAEVYIEGTDIESSARSQILGCLRKAESALKEQILSATGWFKAPHLSFSFDDSLSNANALDKIFQHLAKERENKGNSNDK